jgi:hypothetical protein
VWQIDRKSILQPGCSKAHQGILDARLMKE